MDSNQPKRDSWQTIEDACRGAGVKWIRTVSTYNIDAMKETLRSALTTDAPGLKVVVAEGECMLNRQRRIKPLIRQSVSEGRRVKRARFYIDPETCTGDHGCIRLSGCPSLTIRENPDPLRSDPVSYVDNSCVGCGVCGTNAHSAVLCPSFSRVEMIHNPNVWDRLLDNTRSGSRVVAGSRSEADSAAVLMSREDATINMVIAALGGEGGGVLTNWLIAAAEQRLVVSEHFTCRGGPADRRDDLLS